MKNFLTTLGLVAFAVTGNAQECDVVLKFKNEVKIHNTGNSLSNLHQWLETELATGTNSKYGGGLEVIIPQIKLPLKASGGTENAEIFKNAVKSGNKAVWSSQFVNDMYSNILTPESYKAWSECMKGKHALEMAKINGDSRFFEGIVQDKTAEGFILKLRWKPVGDMMRATISSIEVTGATYNKNLLKEGTRIGTEFVTIPFYRNKPNVTIAINTDNQGSFGLTIGGPKPNIYTANPVDEDSEITQIIAPEWNYHVNFVGINPVIEIQKSENNEQIISGSISDSFQVNVYEKNPSVDADGVSTVTPIGAEPRPVAEPIQVHKIKYKAVFDRIGNMERRGKSIVIYYFKLQSGSYQIIENGQSTNVTFPTPTIELGRVVDDGDNITGNIMVNIGELGNYSLPAILVKKVTSN